MWAGQAASLGRALPAGELTRGFAAEALELIRTLAEPGQKSYARVTRRRVPQGSAVSMPAADHGAAADRPAPGAS